MDNTFGKIIIVLALSLAAVCLGFPDNPADADTYEHSNGKVYIWNQAVQAWMPYDVTGIAGGGTGATTAAAARSNLDLYSTGEVNAAITFAVGQIETTVGALTATDLGLGNVVNIDSTDAGNISSGTLANDRLGIVDVAHGGTGHASLVAGNFLVGNGANAVSLQTPAQVKAALNLDSLPNYAVASVADAEAGLAADKLMTPARVQNQINTFYRVCTSAERNAWAAATGALCYDSTLNTMFVRTSGGVWVAF